jgi:hypothetical protein
VTPPPIRFVFGDFRLEYLFIFIFYFLAYILYLVTFT